MTKNEPIVLYTDGAASGNPGPGGWGAVLLCKGLRKELSGGFSLTTNNRMELLAVINGLEAIRWDRATVHIYSDSTYVVKSVEEGWLDGWLARGWKKTKNVDLWRRFLPLRERHELHFHWVKGHAENPENECCDRLAVAARSLPGLPPDPGYDKNF